MSGVYLKQSTASQSRAIGPFLDDTDFKTAETALTIANTDIKLIVNGGASANKNSGGGTHRANGVYGVTFDATDSATVGELEVSVVVAGALPVFKVFYVLEEAVYDAMFAASAPGYLQPATAGRQLVVDAAGLADANAVKVGPTGAGVAQSARNLGGQIIIEGTLVSSADSTHVTFPATSSPNDNLIGATWYPTGGAGALQAGRIIVDWDDGTNTATLSPALTTTVDNTTTFQVQPTPQAPTTNLLQVDVTSLGGSTQSATDLKDFADDGYDPATNKVQGVVLVDTITNYTGNTKQTGDNYPIVSSVTSGNAALKTLIDAIDNFVDTEITDIQNRLPAVLISGRMDSSIGAAAANTLTASALATDAVTEIVTAMLTTVLTEAYRANGAAPTFAQFMCEVLGRLAEPSISGTTRTIKKFDHSTTAMTDTLNDATTPTAVTRAS
jgi:hypothetical protein